MAYQLGIDLGTATTTAAIRHDDRVEAVRLDDGLLAAPSAVGVDDEGRLVFGHDAAQLALTDPGRAVSDPLARLGSTVNLAGVDRSIDDLVSRYLRWVVDEVTSHRLDQPTRIVLTHPARWGDRDLDRFRRLVANAGVGDVELLPAAVAAAVRYASRSKVPDHALVGVHDLGAGGVDVTVVRVLGPRLTVLAHDGSTEVSGTAVDEAIAQRVVAEVGTAWARAMRRPDAPARRAALVDECRRAKEALAHDAAAEVIVPLPSSARRTVTLGRTEVEAMTRPHLAAAASVLQRCVAAADVEARDLHRVVLHGAWTEAPIVGELLAELLGRPVGTDTDPRLAAAEGAATWNRRTMLPAGAEADLVEAMVMAPDPDLGEASAATDPVPGVLDLDAHLDADGHRAGDASTGLRAEVDALLDAGDRRRRRRRLAGVGAAAMALAAAAAVVALPGLALPSLGDSPEESATQDGAAEEIAVAGVVQTRPEPDSMSDDTPPAGAPMGPGPVTNAAWAEAVAADLVAEPVWWEGSTPPADRVDEPVDRVGSAEADAYCAAGGLVAEFRSDGSLTCG
ncbi:MAG: Hsp70 family protein [Acidimicrobiales bacterium]